MPWHKLCDSLGSRARGSTAALTSPSSCCCSCAANSGLPPSRPTPAACLCSSRSLRACLAAFSAAQAGGKGGKTVAVKAAQWAPMPGATEAATVQASHVAPLRCQHSPPEACQRRTVVTHASSAVAPCQACTCTPCQAAVRTFHTAICPPTPKRSLVVPQSPPSSSPLPSLRRTRAVSVAHKQWLGGATWEASVEPLDGCCCLIQALHLHQRTTPFVQLCAWEPAETMRLKRQRGVKQRRWWSTSGQVDDWQRLTAAQAPAHTRISSTVP